MKCNNEEENTLLFKSAAQVYSNGLKDQNAIVPSLYLVFTCE